MQKQYIECGEVIGTHGVRGEIKLQPWADNPEYLLEFDTLYIEEGNRAFPVLNARLHKDGVLLRLKGCDSLEQARALRGEIFYINREDDPDQNTPFVQDMFGLQVSDIDTGQDYGTIEDVIFTGANLVYVLRDTQQVERLIPAIPQVIITTDLEARTMQIRPLEGLFDLEN